MKKKPPSFRKKKSVLTRLKELSVIDDIDEMLREGMGLPDVVKFIQLGLEELTDTTPGSLENVLAEYRVDLLRRGGGSGGDEHRLAEKTPNQPMDCRRPGAVARRQYATSRNGIDRMIELESLYLAQRDRLDVSIMREQMEGELCGGTDRAIVAAAKLLELHGREEQQMLDRLGPGPAHDKLNIQGYSEETAKVLSQPDSRRRVVSIVERLRRVRGSRQIPELPEASGE